MVLTCFQDRARKIPASQFCVLALLLITCTGCWEEIRYDPDKFQASTRQQDQANVPAQPEPRLLLPSPTVEGPPSSDALPTTPPTDSTSDTPIGPSWDVLKLDDPPQSVAQPAPPAELDLPANEPPADVPARTSLAVWRMSSQWSLAVAIYAKGLAAVRYGDALDQAVEAAKLLQVELPALPEPVGTAPLQSMVIVYLLEEAGPRLASQVDERLAADHAALVELAVKTHGLLLVYSPHDTELGPVVTAIGQAAESSSLPEALWLPLLELLDQRAEFKEVKRAVFQLHEQVESYLNDAAKVQGIPSAK